LACADKFLRSPHVITFLRTPQRPPQFATFQVPLRFTKLDIRDYLWNLYNVEVTSVRSQVRLSPLTQRPLGKQIYRPVSKKFMMVELVNPFHWPTVPSNLEPWSKTLWQSRSDEWENQSKEQLDKMMGRILLAADARVDGRPAPDMGGKNRKRRGARRRRRNPKEKEMIIREVPPDRLDLAKRAAALRSGSVRWKQGAKLDVKWTAAGLKVPKTDYRTEREQKMAEARRERRSQHRTIKQAAKIMEKEEVRNTETPKRSFNWKRNLLGRWGAKAEE